jgi:hypothetical protein
MKFGAEIFYYYVPIQHKCKDAEKLDLTLP